MPTLAFPTMFFGFFAVPRPGRDDDLLMASFAAFAVLGVAFFQFGVGIAGERASPWQVYLRTLPVGPAVRFAARILAATVFALASAALVVAAALLATSASLPARRWLELAAVLALGSVPFALLGIAIAYWSTPRGALPLANVLYLGLAYLGGLWTGAQRLPGPVEDVSRALPTRAWENLLGAATGAAPWRARDPLVLAGYAVALAALAAWGYRRDEGTRYR